MVQSGMCANTTIGVLERSMLQVRADPSELLVAQSAETARLELQDVDQADEVHAGMIETVVAAVIGGPTEATGSIP